MIARRFFASLLGCAVFLTVCEAASARTGSLTKFETSSSGGISFTVSNLTSSALSGSQSYSYTLQGTSGSTAGSVTVTAPVITGNDGNTIPAAAFSATCTESVDRYSSFNPSGTVTLGSSPVACATITASSYVYVTFTVTLTLNCTAAPYGFPAATPYTNSAAMSVTANLP